MKIGNIFRMLVLAVMASAFITCSKDDQFHHNQQEIEGGALLPMSDMTIHPLGDSFEVLYTASEPWTISKNQSSWIRLKDSKGNVLTAGSAGSTKIRVEVDHNLSGDRDCTISFISGGNTDRFKITQKKAVLEVTAYQDSLNFDWRKDTLKLDVKSNVEWTIDITDYKSSFSYEVSEDENGRLQNDKEIYVNTIAPNFGDEENKAVIRLFPVKRNHSGEDVNYNINLSEEIALTQDYLYFKINGVDDGDLLSSYSHLGADYVDMQGRFSEHVTSQTLRVECEEEWVMDDTAFADSWGLSVQKGMVDRYYNRDLGRYVLVHDLKIDVCKPNPSKEVRCDTLQLILEGEVEGSERRIPIEQDAYVFDIIKGKETHLANNPETASGYESIHLNTIGPWRLTAESDHSAWLEVLKDNLAVPFGSTISGIGPVDIAVRVDEQNLYFKDLDVNLLFNTGIHDNAEVSDTAKVIQNRFRFEFTEKADDIGEPWSRLDMRSHNATLVSDGPWTLELQDVLGTGAEEWLDVNVVSADGTTVLDIENHTVKGEAGEWILSLKANGTNNGNADRVKSIRMTSDIHSQMGGVLPEKALLNFDVTQEKYRFDIVKDAGSIVNTTVQKSSYVSGGEQVYEFKMECGAPWRIASHPSWVRFDCSEDVSGEYRAIKMTVDHNVGSTWQQVRSGQIVVRSYDGLDFSGSVLEEKRFTIWQDKFVFEVPNSTQTFNFAAILSSEKQIEINTLDDAGWELVDVQNWCGIEASDKVGYGPRNIRFRPDDYGLRTSRNSTFKVRSTVLENGPEIPVKISQDGYKFQFDGSSNYNQTLPAFDELKSNNTEPKNKKIVCSGRWTVSGIPDWVEVKSGGTVISNGGSINGDATLSFNANSTNTALAGDNTRKNSKITFTSSVSGYDPLTLTVAVSQDPYVFAVASDYKSPDTPLGNSRGSIAVQSSGSWKVNTEGIASTSTSSGSNNVTFYFNMDDNFQLSPQEGTITVTSDDHKAGDKLEKTLTFTRPAYEFSVGEFVDKTADSEGETITISNLKCTGDLEAEILADADGKIPTWLEIVQQPTDGILKIEVDEYSGGKNAQTRKVQVVLRSEHYKHNEADLAKTITISQNPKSSK
jgi:hypothetical protein